MRRPPDTPEQARLTPDHPPDQPSIRDRLTADSPPVRSRRRTHRAGPLARPRTTRTTTGRRSGTGAKPTRGCFSRLGTEMPPPRRSDPRSCGGGGISAVDQHGQHRPDGPVPPCVPSHCRAETPARGWRCADA